MASNEEHLRSYHEALVSLISIETSLPKIMTGCDKLVELYLTKSSTLENAKMKTKFNKRKFANVPSILARLLHELNDETD